MKKVEVCKEFYTIALLRANRNKIYLFGDNDIRTGKGGQAIIRDELNVLGIRTKKYPGTDDTAYYSDEDFYDNCGKIAEDFHTCFFLKLLSDKIIVIPGAGIGTGRAELEKRAPKTFRFLQTCLKQLQGGSHE